MRRIIEKLVRDSLLWFCYIHIVCISSISIDVHCRVFYYHIHDLKATWHKIATKYYRLSVQRFEIEIWQMQLIRSKCKVMHLGKRNPQYTFLNLDSESRIPFESTLYEWDLGVIISSILKLTLQCSKSVARVSSICS